MVSVIYTSIKATFEAKTPLYLPAFTGFTIRGALGQWLKKRHCIFENYKTKICSKCKYLKTCGYGYLYEYGKDIERPLPYTIPPKAFSLIPPQGKNYDIGETFTITIYIFHKEKRVWLSSIIHEALNNMKQIGKYKSRGYGKIELKEIEQKEETLTKLPPLKEKLRVEFSTPTILAREGYLVNKPSLYDITTFTARKKYVVEKLYYNKDNTYELKHILETKKAQTYFEKLKGIQIKRWSEKRNRKEKINAIKGVITYSIDELSNQTKDFLRELLAFATIYGIGRRTSAGLGRVKITTYS